LAYGYSAINDCKGAGCQLSQQSFNKVSGVENYPHTGSFSVKISQNTKPGTLFIFGKLIIRGKAWVVSFPFTATPKGVGHLPGMLPELVRNDVTRRFSTLKPTSREFLIGK
jgi:hypothetical protein